MLDRVRQALAKELGHPVSVDETLWDMAGRIALYGYAVNLARTVERCLGIGPLCRAPIQTPREIVNNLR